jgi:hypothetical protein
VLVGSWAQSESVSIAALLVAAAATVFSRAQRQLSTPARRIRRSDEPIEVEGWTRDELLSTWERALLLLSVAMPLLALGLLAGHL